jgi:predicted glycosyltransferase
MTRVLIHVQHLLGTGHLRRAAAIAAAIAERGAAVTLLSGGPPVGHLDCGGAALVQLPPVRAVDATFRTLLDPEGRDVDDGFKAMRRARVLAAFAEAKPDVVITELYPFGRKLLAFELVPLVDAAQAAGARLVCSLRDIVVAKTEPKRRAAILASAARYRQILVHGDPALLPLEASLPDAGSLSGIVYTGYVEGPAGPEPPPGEGDGEVIVSSGGGRVGAALVDAAIAARPLSAARDRLWRILLGGGFDPVARARAAGAARAGIIVQPERPDFPGLLARAGLSISQAGYNTVVDVVRAGVRSVLVPFAAANEREQSLRAAAFLRLGRAEVVEERALSPQNLAAAVDRSLRGPAPSLHVMKLGGAAASAAAVLDALTDRP